MQIVTPFRRNDDDDDDSSTLNSSFNYLTNILLFGRIFREKKTEEASSDSPLISTPTKTNYQPIQLAAPTVKLLFVQNGSRVYT